MKNQKNDSRNWNREDLLSGLRVMFIGLAVMWMAGCQGPDSAGKTNKPVYNEKIAIPPVQNAPSNTKPTAVDAPPVDAQVKVVKPEGVKVSGKTPKITVEKDVIDLGEIGMESKHSGQFKFTNTGDASLRINQIQTCCGVVTKGVEAGQEYAPGQSGVLKFEYQSLAMPNPAFSRMLYLQTNDPEHGTVTLTIKAAVVRRVDYKPEKLRLRLDATNSGCPEITLVSLDGRPFSIIEFKSTADVVRAKFDSNTKATQFVLKPTVDMAKLKNNMQGQIRIDLTHPECTNVTLPYDTLPEFEANTSTILLFSLKAGQAIQREIWIWNNYQHEFEIGSVSSPKGIIKLLEKKKVDSRYRLRIEIIPPVQGNNGTLLSETLQIKIKDADTMSIQFRGFYQ